MTPIDHDHDHDHDHHNHIHGDGSRFLPDDVREELKKIFTAVPNNVHVYLFGEKGGQNELHVQLARELITEFTEVSKKIKFKEYDLKHKNAAKWGVRRSPTLVFEPDLYRIHYLGVPLGEEGRTLVEILLMTGLRNSRFNDAVKKVTKRIDGSRNIRVFVNPSCPYCPQQAVNAVRAAIERPDIVSVEIVDTSFNEDLAELYHAHSVPQTFANDVLISKGAQPAELFAASLETMEEQRIFIPESDAELVEADLVIIGGGPAGLTAAIYAARSGLNAVVVEQGVLGGQVATTPVVENYPGLAQIGGKNLVEIMVDHALQYVNIFPQEKVIEIKPGDERMDITTSLRRFTARSVLLATGAKYRRLGAPGEERLAGRGVSYCSTCDGPLFVGKKVAIVGGGDSAVTEALHLHHLGVNVTLIHRRDTLRAQDHLTKDLLEKGIPVLWNTAIKEIRGKEKVSELVLFNNQTSDTSTMAADGVFVTIGYDPEVELAKALGVELTPQGYIKHDGRHRTNVRGIYCAGDVEGGYKQIVTAAGAGAAAAMNIFEDLTHPYWKEKEEATG
jgi:thioredoxin reductase (NADPH)